MSDWSYSKGKSYSLLQFNTNNFLTIIGNGLSCPSPTVGVGVSRTSICISCSMSGGKNKYISSKIKKLKACLCEFAHVLCASVIILQFSCEIIILLPTCRLHPRSLPIDYLRKNRLLRMYTHHSSTPAKAGQNGP